MARMRKTIGIAGLLGLALFAAAIHAGGFEVNPVRIMLDKKKPTAAITLRNTGEHPVVVQAETLSWTQVDGQNTYAPSRDLLVNPPIFTVQPGKTQVVRVGLDRPVDPRNELAYRLYLREVPPTAALAFSGLRVALRIGLPVFVAPEAPIYPALQWRVRRTADGALGVEAVNAGNSHIQIIDLRLALPGNGRDVLTALPHAYLFPGQRGQWTLTPTHPWHGDRVLLSATTDQGGVKAEIALEKP